MKKKTFVTVALTNCVCFVYIHAYIIYVLCVLFQISGDANEDQILTAATLYMGRPEILTRVLNDLYHLFRNGRNDPNKQWTTLDIILEGMDMHVLEKHIQICGR